MKQIIRARSLTSNTAEWLASTCQPRLLHVFDRACNLINERGEVLSVVTSQIGDGPFNLVIGADIVFSDHLHIGSSVSIADRKLDLGNLTVQTAQARLWNSQPDFRMLYAARSDILIQLAMLPIQEYSLLQNFPAGPALQFSTSVALADVSTAKSIASKLAGLGVGLTPSGDDFMMGAMYAAWILHPPEIASLLATEIAASAAPLTTSLSAAWLRSAGRGEAGALWHEFFSALLVDNPSDVERKANALLSVGATSGADALAGFFGVCFAFKESILHPVTNYVAQGASRKRNSLAPPARAGV